MTATAPPSHDDLVRVAGRLVAYKWVVAGVYVAALFLDTMDATVINVALPRLALDLHTASVEWAILGYTLSLAVWIPASGWLGDRFGTKRIFLFALSAFTAGSMACGLSQSIGQLIAFRVVQGVGGGMLTPVGFAMLFRAFPPAERAKASTIVMIATMVSPAMGPVVGGFITTHFDWRWIFFINVPIAIPALWFGWRYLREHREPTSGRLDVLGLILSGGSLATIVYAFSEGPTSGWTSFRVAGVGGLGLLLGALMVYVELRLPKPLLDLRLLKNRLFRQCNLVSFFSMASLFGVTFVMPQYLQNLRGLDPLASGLVTFPQALGIMISSLVAGRLYGAIGPRRLMTGAFVAAALTVALFTRITLSTSLWLIRGLLMLRGLAMGFAFVPMQAASYATIPPAQNGRASSLYSAQRQVGVSFGIAILASILTAHGVLRPPVPVAQMARALTGVHFAFGVAVGFALLSGGLSFLIKDEDAKATMVVRARRR